MRYLYKGYHLLKEGEITGFDFVIQQGEDEETYVSGFSQGGAFPDWKGKEDITGHLFSVGVSQDKQGQGVGTVLIILALRYIYSKGIDLFVTAPNQASSEILKNLESEGVISYKLGSKKERETRLYRLLPAIQNKLPEAKLKSRATAVQALGKTIVLSMPNGEKRDARFAIVELDSVLASHNEQTFAPTPGYPTNERGQNVNDRNYEDDVAAQERVRDNARRLDPYRLLTTSRTPSGSPIVAGQQIDGKWIVVSGNNRTMSTKLAASKHPENYKAYVDALCEELEAFGFSTTDKTERIDCQNGKLVYLPTGDDFSINNDAYHFRQPLLVRIDYGFPAFQTQELAKYNQSTMKGKRAVDKTIERSNSLRENPLCQTRIPAMLDQHERMSDFYADRTAQKQMLEALLQCNIITEQSVPEYYDEGYFTNAGKELVESVLAGVVLEKAALKAAERDGIKQARRVVVYAMPVLVSNSTLPGSANLIPHINDAILYLNEMKASGLPFDQFVNQGALFSEKKWHPRAIYLSRLMSQGQRKFKTAIKAFNESVRRNTGAALFSDENVTPEEAFQAYVIDRIPAEEARLIEAYANAPNPPKSRYPDWLFVGNMGGSTVYADRRKRKNGDYLSIAHLNPYNGEVTRLIKPADKDYSQDYELVYRLAEEDGAELKPETKTEPDPRPGDYFVSVHDQGQRPVLALGPFPKHQEALDNVGAVREYVTANDPQGPFYAYGTARQEKGTGNTGKLNSKLGYAPECPLLAQRGVPAKTDTFFAHGIQVKVTDHGGKDGNCRMPYAGPRLLNLQAKPGSQLFMQDYYKAVCEAARRYDGLYYEVGGPAEELVNKLLKGALESGEPSVKIIFGSRQEVCGRVYHKIRYVGKALPPPVLSPYEQIFMESFGISQADAHEIWMRAMDEYGRPLDDVSRAELIRRGRGQLDALKWERTEEGYQYLIGLHREMLGLPREEAKTSPEKKPKIVKQPFERYVVNTVEFFHVPDPEAPDRFQLEFHERNSDEKRHVQVRDAFEQLRARLRSEGFEVTDSWISQFDPIDWETWGHIAVSLKPSPNEASTKLLLAKAKKKKKLQLLKLA